MGFVDFMYYKKYNYFSYIRRCETLAKMGRPNADNPRSNVLAIRFTEAELEELKDRAAKYNLTIAETVRKDLKLKKQKKS